MISIISNPRLEREVGDFANRGTAIQESLINTANLCDVCVNRNRFAIRQNKHEMKFRMLAEDYFEV